MPKSGARLISNAVHSLFNTTVINMVTWVVAIWITRQLGPENYGIMTFLLWFTGIFTWIIGMGLTHAVTKFIAEYSGRQEEDIKGPLLFFVLRIEIVFSIIVTAILVLLKGRIVEYFFNPTVEFLFLLSFLGIIPGIITAIFSATIEGIQEFKYFTYSNLLITPLNVISKIVVIKLGMGIKGLLIVMLVFSVINAIFYYIVLSHEGVRIFKRSKPLDMTLKERIFQYNKSVLSIILMDKIVWDKSENFFLGRFCQAKEIGFYNLGFNIAHRFASILPSTFWRVLFPAMSNYFGSGNKKKMSRLFFISTRYIAFVSFPMGAAGIILAYELIHYLYGHEFIGAQHVLQIIFFTSLASSLSKPGSAILYGYEKQSFIFKFGFVMAIFNIILDIFLIRKYGAIGAAICYGITTMIGSIGGIIYTCNKMKLKYPFVSLFKILLSTIIMGVTMEIIILKNNEIPGLILSIVTGTFVYLVCALVLGTFEEEDYSLLESVKDVLPGKTKGLMDMVINFISEFKNVNNGNK